MHFCLHSSLQGVGNLAYFYLSLTLKTDQVSNFLLDWPWKLDVARGIFQIFWLLIKVPSVSAILSPVILALMVLRKPYLIKGAISSASDSASDFHERWKDFWVLICKKKKFSNPKCQIIKRFSKKSKLSVSLDEQSSF